MDHAATTYDSQKNVIDGEASQRIFSLKFAVAAFEAGDTAGPGRNPSALMKSNIRSRIKREIHTELARCCLAYLLSHEIAHDPQERGAYLKCVRQIRDGAREIMAAADELAAQLSRHYRETGYLEAKRATTLLRLAGALYRDTRNDMGQIPYAEKIKIRPIGNPLSGDNLVHGLTACAALSNEADHILDENKAGLPPETTNPQISIGMSTGNKTNVNKEAFIIDLAKLFTSVIQRQPTANDSANGAKSPFVRFVTSVFEEMKFQRTSIVGERPESTFDQKAYAAPSTSTLKSILKRQTQKR